MKANSKEAQRRAKKAGRIIAKARRDGAPEWRIEQMRRHAQKWVAEAKAK